MKKLLLTFAISLLATTIFAETLQISISDPINNINPLTEVKVELNTKTAEYINEDKIYEFIDFTPSAGLKIKFEHQDSTKYVAITDGRLAPCLPDAIPKCEYEFNYANYSTNNLIDVPLTKGSDGNYTLNIEMYPLKTEIISGTITAKKRDNFVDIKDYSKIKPIISGTDGHFADSDIDDDGNYIIKGYLGTSDISRNYTVVFTYSPYESVEREFKVKDKKIENTDKTNIVFDIPTGRESREDNLYGITGFGCDELMPKYLVGASCVENSDLEGDATDIAVWIQKFGGMITSLISMIAVVLIVWNAFNMVTAAGDTEKISQAKKGIMWTIIGLAVTMFAYVIVINVIMFIYTA